MGVISIPHSGTRIPATVTSFLTTDDRALARDIDPEVQRLIDIEKLNRNGFSVIKTNVHRSIVDVNRPISTSVSYWQKNTAGESVCVRDIPEQLKAALLEEFYTPYYEKIFQEMAMMSSICRAPLLFDLHSTPSRFPEYYRTKLPQLTGEMPDFCLSNLDGKTSDAETINRVQQYLQQSFRDVRLNAPFKGGNITQAVKGRFPNANVIQIEILRRHYMNEGASHLDEAKIASLKEILTNALIPLNHA